MERSAIGKKKVLLHVLLTPEDDADAPERVRVLTIYKILFMYAVHLLVWVIK